MEAPVTQADLIVVLTFLSVVVLAVSTFFAIRTVAISRGSFRLMSAQTAIAQEQLTAQVTAAKYARTYDQLTRLEAPRFRAIREFVGVRWTGGYPCAAATDNTMVREYSNVLDTIGRLYCGGYLDNDLILDVYGRAIVQGHRKCSCFIEHERRALGGKPRRFQEYFSLMALSLEVEYARKYPDDPIDVPSIGGVSV
jgi:hypothetical protein